MANPKKVKLSIIILSWNTKQLLRQCLKSLISNYEIIVVDNGSEDGSKEYLRDLERKRLRNIEKKKISKSLKVIFNKENLGFAKGNNQGIKIAKGEYVMLLNSDTVVKEGALEKLVEFLDKNPGVGAISPLLLNEDGSIQKDPCYLKYPSPTMALFYYNKILRWLAKTFLPQIIFSATEFQKPVEVEQLPGAALMVRRKVLKEVRGLDEDYKLYFEDTDLCWRIKKLGYKLMVVPQAKIVHLGRKSIEPVIQKRGIEKFYFLNFRSLFLFCRKHYPFWKTLLIEIIVFTHLISTLKFRLVCKLIVFDPEN